MRLLRYSAATKKWIQLFSDDALSSNANLADLKSAAEARNNLELDRYYWNKASLKDGIAVNAIDNICVIQDSLAQFISQADRENWNNKVDRPIVSSALNPDDLTEGQFFLNQSSDTAYVKLGDAVHEIARSVRGVGRFSGSGAETVIAHGIKTAAGNGIVPKYVSFSPMENPMGTLGETWFRKDDKNIYIGNTGSYKGNFGYVIFY